MFLVALVSHLVLLFLLNIDVLTLNDRTEPSSEQPSLESQLTSVPSTTSAGTPALTSSPAVQPNSSGVVSTLFTPPRSSSSLPWSSSRSAQHFVVPPQTQPLSSSVEPLPVLARLVSFQDLRSSLHKFYRWKNGPSISDSWDLCLELHPLLAPLWEVPSLTTYAKPTLSFPLQYIHSNMTNMMTGYLEMVFLYQVSPQKEPPFSEEC